MTIREFFEDENLDKDDLDKVSELSDYWSSAANFIIENWDEDLDDMTERQITWAHKIQEDMTELRIEGRLR